MPKYNIFSIFCFEKYKIAVLCIYKFYIRKYNGRRRKVVNLMALNREELLAYLENNAEIKGDCDVLETDCRNIIFLLDNCEITIPENNRFFVDNPILSNIRFPLS